MTNDIENLQNAHDSLKRIHIASNDANEKLLRRIEELESENEYLKTLLINADQNILIQKTIVINSIQSSQEKHERDYQEILELKNEIKQLKHR